MTKRIISNPLFRPGPNQLLNACVADNGGPYDFGAYGEGFFEGGFQIVNSIKRGEWHIDILIYPATFCFRHGIELYLKHLIHMLAKINLADNYKPTHDIADNFDFFNKFTKSKPGLIDEIQLATSKKLIEYFIMVDETGQVFRYPEDRKGNQHLAGISVINIEVLEKGMKELHSILEDWRNLVEELVNPS